MTEKATLSIIEASKYSGIGQCALRWQAKNNPKFPAFRVGKKIVIMRTGLDEWIAEMAQKRVGFAK